MKDIVPELLDNIETEFHESLQSNAKLMSINRLIESGKATYEQANEYSIEVGKLLVEAYKNNISSEILPDGKMYYNIANRILNPTLKDLHSEVSEVTTNIQNNINKTANIGIKGISPKFNQNRADGIIEKISSVEYEKVSWILDEPVMNFSQAIVDETAKENAMFQAKSGLKPKIVRTVVGGCCDWCRNLSGTYEYPDVPKEVYQRHRYCRCTVDYYPGDGRKQNVHNKSWLNLDKDEIEERKNFNPITNTEKYKIVKENQITKIKDSLGNKNFKEFSKVLDNSSTPIKKLYAKYADKLPSSERIKGGGVFKGHVIEYDLASDSYIQKGRNKFATLSHEYGHYFDNVDFFEELGFKEVDAIVDSLGTLSPISRKPSVSDEFLKAIRKDRESLSQTFFVDSAIKDDLLKSYASAGVQDAIGGFFGRSKSQLIWGHDDKYWNRKYGLVKSFKQHNSLKKSLSDIGLNVKNQSAVAYESRIYEAASETWANIISAETTQGETLEYVKKYLPNSYEAFQGIMGKVE